MAFDILTAGMTINVRPQLIRSLTVPDHMKITLLALLCSAALFVTGCASAHSRPSACEYKVLEKYVSGNNVENTLNELAKDGWVVVTSSTSVEPGNTPKIHVILKRIKNAH